MDVDEIDRVRDCGRLLGNDRTSALARGGLVIEDLMEETGELFRGSVEAWLDCARRWNDF